VLPGGYDAEGIANQAIQEMLAGDCRLAVGWTRERLVRELRRVVGRRVRGLHHLKEAAAMRSEWEGANGAEHNTLEGLADAGESADAAATRREEEERRERVIKEFDEFLKLKGEPELRGIFGCLCAGVEESKEMAGNSAWASSREVTQRSSRASVGLALRTESRASVLVAPFWRGFSQIRRMEWS
jgi:hypothetical protein